MNFDQAVGRLTAQFDVTTAQAADFLNERLARMLAQSEYEMVKKSLGTTTAGVSNYPIPADLVDVSRIRVDDGDTVTLYDGVPLERLWDVDSDPAVTVRGNVFAPDYQADGDPEVRLYPAPEKTGLTITGLYAQLPATITYGGAAAVPLPVDVHTHWLAGGQADCYDLEGRADMAQKFEGRFAEGVGVLVKRKNSRADGSAPARVMVWGWDYA